jgi:predicted Zn finger-like uncharacterized protein
MALALKTTCPKCHANLRVGDEHIARQVRCSQCRHLFAVQSAELSTPEAAPASAVETLAPKEEQAPTYTEPRPRRADGKLPTQVLGRFQLREILGQGSYGRVFRAYDPQLDREVALKVPIFGADDTKRARRFLTEAKAAARLRHPNIVPVYESGEAGGQCFIAAQFVAGQTLAKRIEVGPVEFREAAQWVRSLAEALAYAHGEGIVHRDIKPENIMLDDKEQPQIMDFGLAKRTSDDAGQTVDGSILGTPAYMPPEQARGEQAKVGPASDQYSLGAVLYELLAGRRPFEGPAHSVLAKLLSEEPPGLRSLRADVPRDLEAICQKAMCKEPEGRYAALQDFAEDLRRWLSDVPTKVRPAGYLERISRWARREPRVAGLTLAVAVSLVLAASISLRFAVSERAAAERDRIARDELQGAKNSAEAARDSANIEKEKAVEEQQRADREAANARYAESQAKKNAEDAESAANEARQAKEKSDESALEAKQKSEQLRLAANELGIKNEELDKTVAELRTEKRFSKLQLARSKWEQASRELTEGSSAMGLLLLAQALKEVPEEGEDAAVLARSIRMTIAAELASQPQLVAQFMHGSRVLDVDYNTESTLRSVDASGVLREWSLEKRFIQKEQYLKVRPGLNLARLFHEHVVLGYTDEEFDLVRWTASNQGKLVDRGAKINGCSLPRGFNTNYPHLALTGGNGREGFLQTLLWNNATKPAPQIKAGFPLGVSAFHVALAARDLALVASDNRVLAYQTGSGDKIAEATLPDVVDSFSFSKGRYFWAPPVGSDERAGEGSYALAVCGRDVHVLDTGSSSAFVPLKTLHKYSFDSAASAIRAHALSPTGRTLVGADRNNGLHALDLASGVALFAGISHPEEVDRIGFPTSQDEPFVAPLERKTPSKKLVDKGAIDKGAIDKGSDDKATLDAEAVDLKAIDEAAKEKKPLEKPAPGKKRLNKAGYPVPELEPQDSLLFVSGGNLVRVWSLPLGVETLWVRQESLEQGDKGNRQLATLHDNVFEIHDRRFSGRSVRTSAMLGSYEMETSLTSLATDPVQNRIAVAGSNGVWIWRLTPPVGTTPMGRLARDNLPLRHHGEQKVTAIAFHPSSNRLLMGTDQGELSVWDLDKRREEQKWNGPGAKVEKVGWDHSGAIAYSVIGSSITLYPVPAGSGSTVQLATPGPILSVAFSTTDKFVVTGHAGGRVQVWDVSSRKASGPGWNQDGDANAVTFFEEDEYVCSTGSHGLTMWRVGEEKEAGRFLRQIDASQHVCFDVKQRAFVLGRFWTLPHPVKESPKEVEHMIQRAVGKRLKGDTTELEELSPMSWNALPK